MRTLIAFILILSAICLQAQQQALHGKIVADGNPLPYAEVLLNDSIGRAFSDLEGKFSFNNILPGFHNITIRYLGFETVTQKIEVPTKNQEVVFKMKEASLNLNQVVVTGSRTFKRKTTSPIIVNVMDNNQLGQVQACNLSEGLRFQPGLRVETDCQTCNYTQLRMNGLPGSYSQILINGRSIFSPLTGLYGMEQMPANMIERIEVVRGGGSALYGSSAIGGTVNIITRIPNQSQASAGFTLQSIGNSLDRIFNASMTMANEKSGITFYGNHRNREWYDHNGDNFSELPHIFSSTIGTSAHFRPSNLQKIEASISYGHEYRNGGEQVKLRPHLLQQSEERTHHSWMGNIDYQIYSEDHTQNLILYGGGQVTSRDHFTGIMPDNPEEIEDYQSFPPYGTSLSATFQGGFQYDQDISTKIPGNHILTIGGEYIFQKINDKIPTYQYLIDQFTHNKALFLQHDWSPSKEWSILSGLRMDQHNLMKKVAINPRLSVLFRPQPNLQFRTTISSGFRAPQAFDADLHIAFAGGGVSRVAIDPTLIAEKAISYSSSVNYDYITSSFIGGFTLEAFHTHLRNPFVLEGIGEDTFGEVFFKSNGDAAKVSGITLENRVNINRKFQWESGVTIQRSRHSTPISYITDLNAQNRFLRTPDHYAYATASFFMSPKVNFYLNGVHTGSMLIAHFAGAPEQSNDAFITSENFYDISLKGTFEFSLAANVILKLEGGIRNIFQAYQSDFDTGKNRDSNYVYGPGLPRTVFVGARITFD